MKIVLGASYYDDAIDLWTRNAPSYGARGHIYDRNGKLIVGNSYSPTIVVIPKQIKDKEKASLAISKVLKCDKDLVFKHLNKHTSIEIMNPVGRKISIKQAKEISMLGIDGIYIVSDYNRYYPYQDLLAPVLGIVGSYNQGITGLEYLYDKYLEGENGGTLIFTDAHGNHMNDLTTIYKSGLSGADLYLTIDLDLQIAMERIIRNAVIDYNPEEVMMIAMNPKTSEIYGMASYPTFDPSNYQDYDPTIYDRNLPIWKCYEPGSVQKIITYAAGIEEEVFRLDEMFYDPGYQIIDGVRIRDWKAGGHGSETFLEVIQNSCNPGFMTIGLRLGKDRLFNYIENFGLGKKTGIDLLGESSGILFNKDKIGNVELATSSFGQGNAVTAIQLINAACAAVNGGNLYTPYIVKEIKRDNEVLLSKKPVLKRRVIKEETSKTMCYALECVASLGTARKAYIEGYRVGGKTGTAQIAENGKYLPNEYILSFLGIAPMNDPEIAIYFAITKPKNTVQYGGVVAAPIVKEALQEAFSALNISKQDGGVPLDARYYIDKKTYIIPDYKGLKKSEVKNDWRYDIIIEGNGDYIIGQLPSPGERMQEGGIVLLYT